MDHDALRTAVEDGLDDLVTAPTFDHGHGGPGTLAREIGDGAVALDSQRRVVR